MASLDQIKVVIGDLARPFAIISTSLAASIATVTIAFRVTTFGEGAAYMAAVFAGVAGLYGFRSWENTRSRRSTDQPDQGERP